MTRHVVCGANSLALRLVEQLRGLDEQVTAVVPDTGTAAVQEMRRLGASLVVGDFTARADLEQAGVGRADAVAFVANDDGGNVSGAIVAEEINPAIRIVVRISSDPLRRRLSRIGSSWYAFSAGAIAAPFFVQAALGAVGARTVVLAGRTLVAGPPDGVGEVLLALAEDTGTPGGTRVLPGGGGAADVVLGTPLPGDPAAPRTVASVLLRPVEIVLGLVRASVDKRLARTVTALLVLIAATVPLFRYGLGEDWQASLYLAVATVTSLGFTDTGLLDGPAWVQLAATVATLLGLLVVALFTAEVVDAFIGERLRQDIGYALRRSGGHHVVCGLGSVGLRVAEQLHAAGHTVVGVEAALRPGAAARLRELRIPVVEGDATVEAVLARAVPGTARCVLALTHDHAANLQIGLAALAANEEGRAVLRLYDLDPAHRFAERLGLRHTRSVSSVSAPVVAARMVAREVVAAVPAGDRILLLADLTLPAGCAYDGRTVAEVSRHGTVAVIGVVDATGRADWSPDPGRRVVGGERLLVAATRNGLVEALVDSGAVGPDRPPPR